LAAAAVFGKIKTWMKGKFVLCYCNPLVGFNTTKIKGGKISPWVRAHQILIFTVYNSIWIPGFGISHLALKKKKTCLN